MISAAAFCPIPPVLVPGVAQGAAVELDELRTACHDAITRIAVPGRRLVVIGPGPAARRYPPASRGTFAGFGLPLEVALGSDEPGPVDLPLALTVGAWLVRDALGANTGAVGYAVASGSDEVDVAGSDIALLVMGDGSARRSTAAPGYFDERAEAFDTTVAAALGSGDGEALAGLDSALGADLLAAGVAAWQAAGALLNTGYDAELLYDDAPYGVGYFVAAWT